MPDPIAPACYTQVHHRVTHKKENSVTKHTLTDLLYVHAVSLFGVCSSHVNTTNYCYSIGFLILIFSHVISHSFLMPGLNNGNTFFFSNAETLHAPL